MIKIGDNFKIGDKTYTVCEIEIDLEIEYSKVYVLESREVFLLKDIMVNN